MLNIPELKEIRSNVTTIRIMMEEDVEAKNIISMWKKNKKYLDSEQSRYEQDITSPNRLKVNEISISQLKFSVFGLKLNGFYLFIFFSYKMLWFEMLSQFYQMD